MRVSPVALALIGLALTNLFWAANAVMARFVSNDIPPLTLSFGRWFIALLILLPFALPEIIRSWPEVRRRWSVILVLGFLGVSAYNSFLYIGAHSTTAVNIALVSATLPLVTLLAVWLMLRQRPSNWQVVGIVISLLGVLTIVSAGDVGQLLHLRFNIGDILVLGITICWAIYSVILEKYPIKLSSVALLTLLIAGGLPLLTILFFIEQHMLAGFNLQAIHWGVFTGLAIFPSILAYLFWGIGVKIVGPNIASLSCYLMPLFAALIAVPLLGESLFSYHWLGGAFILIGLYFGSFFKRD